MKYLNVSLEKSLQLARIFEDSGTEQQSCNQSWALGNPPAARLAPVEDARLRHCGQDACLRHCGPAGGGQIRSNSLVIGARLSPNITPKIVGLAATEIMSKDAHATSKVAPNEKVFQQAGPHFPCLRVRRRVYVSLPV
jgi:hypothetical protein